MEYLIEKKTIIVVCKQKFFKSSEQKFATKRNNPGHVQLVERQHRLRLDALDRPRLSQRPPDTRRVHGSPDKNPSARNRV